MKRILRSVGDGLAVTLFMACVVLALPLLIVLAFGWNRYVVSLSKGNLFRFRPITFELIKASLKEAFL